MALLRLPESPAADAGLFEVIRQSILPRESGVHNTVLLVQGDVGQNFKTGR